MSIEQMDAFELEQHVLEKKKEIEQLNRDVEKLTKNKESWANQL